MKLTLIDKLVIGGLGLGMVGLLAVFVVFTSVQSTQKYHYGDPVRVTTGFYEGCEGYLVKEASNENSHTYTINAVCPDTFHFGLTPITVEITATSSDFEILKDTTTEK